MVDALAVSKRQQQQLVTDASHELRTPLTSLRTNAELLDRPDALERRATAARGAGHPARGERAHRPRLRARRARDRSRRRRGAGTGAAAPAGRGRRRTGAAADRARDHRRRPRATRRPCSSARTWPSARWPTSSTTRRSTARARSRSSISGQPGRGARRRARASRRRTSPTCSTASTAPPRPAPSPARGSGWRSSRQIVERHDGTVWATNRDRAAARPSDSSCPASPPGAAPDRPRLDRAVK